MKLSDFDYVTNYVTRLRMLQSAREAVQYHQITAKASLPGEAEYDLRALTSISECRQALMELIDRNIAGVKTALEECGVVIDGH